MQGQRAFAYLYRPCVAYVKMMITRIASQINGTYPSSRLLLLRDHFQSGESKVVLAVLTATNALSSGRGIYCGAIFVYIFRVFNESHIFESNVAARTAFYCDREVDDWDV